MTLKRLVLWRHAETEFNAAGRIQGQLDSELTPLGKDQAKRAAPTVAEYRPDVVVGSDLRRVVDTAAAFTEVTGRDVPTDPRLRETRLGEWQGLSGAEVEHGWPGEMAVWRGDPTYAPPGGESRIEAAARASEVVAELDESHSGTALLCTHGGVITGITARLLRWPQSVWSSLGGIANCHWVVLVRRDSDHGRWRLLTYNGGITE